MDNSALPTLVILSALSAVGYTGTRVVKSIQFDRDIGGHLKLAADANSLDLAEHEIAIALDNLGDTCARPGFTSVLYTTPDEDVGFWCSNLQATHDDLVSLPGEVDDLTESNQLIKVRETLLDHGDHVTAPDGITVYPHNVAFAWWGWLSLLTLCVSGSAVTGRTRTY